LILGSEKMKPCSPNTKAIVSAVSEITPSEAEGLWAAGFL